MATNPANVYCTIYDIADLISMNSVSLCTDDGPPTNLGAAIQKAGNRVDFYVGRRYTPSELAKSSLVVEWAAAIAAYHLRTRRGNPAAPGAQIHYAQAIADMTEVKLGRNQIPGISPRKGFVPTISIKQVVQRPFNRAVIETDRGSTVTVAENIQQEVSVWTRLGYNCNGLLNVWQN